MAIAKYAELLERPPQVSMTWKAALYIRLSREDGDKAESNSITSQREILKEYLKLHPDIELYDFYVDDGWSGTNFDRPDFKRMIRDIENGHIDCVVVKDLSRLGRNYAKMGYYTEEYFTDRGVRFIAINDSVDNMRDEENDLAPFKNVLNEWYPRDVSKKIRQVRRKNAQLGYFTGGTPAYGYRKDPTIR